MDARVKYIKDRKAYAIVSKRNLIFQAAGSFGADARWVRLMFVPDGGFGDGTIFFNSRQDAERQLELARNTEE